MVKKLKSVLMSACRELSIDKDGHFYKSCKNIESVPQLPECLLEASSVHSESPSTYANQVRKKTFN